MPAPDTAPPPHGSLQPDDKADVQTDGQAGRQQARPVTDAGGTPIPEGSGDRPLHEYGRPAVIEDASNRYFIHPLSALAAKAAIALSISPNAISILGLGFGLLAGWLYYHLPQAGSAIGGFAAMVCWHILDGADGRVARATGQTSALGRVIDGVCDHVVFTAVYVALALHLVESGQSPAIWWLVVGAGVSHAVQAAGYEERRQRYQRRAAGMSARRADTGAVTDTGTGFDIRVLPVRLYEGAQKLVTGSDNGLDARLADLDGTERGQRLRALALRSTAGMVRVWSLLNANNRTLMIFVTALAGQPLLYFVFELVVLNLVMAGLLLAERRQEKALVTQSLRLYQPF
ncbi:CDP-alcohol phosphatidyltransferase family protein [Eilatimonas milleporae]|uniref:CDP-alcohol phosphatidyltransferase-like enzyme n=1 Tax=Eilatimonas milleporae TaxID=911205 RepID=A0A3M0CDC7_9PROT|nr:CDP-alcohol phosphatidyltransferase family protein [Eilatimonas milleporae]RMB07748.1 CDP-alcohol phosphatidyltransferase-like enzyme [Eilatimonas milleporae]